MTLLSLSEAAALQACAYAGGRPDCLPPGFSLTAVVDQGEVQGIIATRGPSLRVAVLQGTNQPHEWLSNMDSRRRYRGGYLIHKGFLDAADRIWEQVAPYRPNRLIGHSRAAAGVSILSVLHGIPAIGFAAPRAFWLWRPREAQVLTVNNPADGVTRVPPGFLWHHAGWVLNLAPGRADLSEDHRIREYLERLAAGGILGGISL